jgi:uncharacterized lipoprotein YddW (UPF0748 family)
LLIAIPIACGNQWARGLGNDDLPDPPLREFRGVFVPTAYNLDWPSRPGLHRKVQRDEIRAIVHRTKELNCNVIILQVRAFGDRIHRRTGLAKPEPWSAALNHRHDPDKWKLTYDPLGEWIKACHAEGIELHAWVNPFRVDSLIEVGNGNENPQVLPVIPTEDGYHMYLDPSWAEVQSYVIEVIADLLDYSVELSGTPASEARIDGILFDHYLPGSAYCQTARQLSQGLAAEPQEGEDKSASKTPLETDAKKARIKWLLKKAGDPGQNPNPVTMSDFIEKAYRKVHEDHGAKFGISPLSDDKQAMQWLNQGLVNYVVPELYFKGSASVFKPALDKWLDEIPKAQDGFTPIIVAGLFATRVQSPEPDSDNPWPPLEIINQIGESRKPHNSRINLKASGQAHYSWSALRSPNHGGPGPANNLGELLKVGQYFEAALVPQCTKGRGAAPKAPTVKLVDSTASWNSAAGENAKLFLWAVWLHDQNGWGPMQVFPATQTSLTDVPPSVNKVAVGAVDHDNQISQIKAATRQ